jgi:hypothetical protein
VPAQNLTLLACLQARIEMRGLDEVLQVESALLSLIGQANLINTQKTATKQRVYPLPHSPSPTPCIKYTWYYFTSH